MTSIVRQFDNTIVTRDELKRLDIGWDDLKWLEIVWDVLRKISTYIDYMIWSCMTYRGNYHISQTWNIRGLYWENSPNHPNPIHSRLRDGFGRDRRSLPWSHVVPCGRARISRDGQEAIDKEAEEHLAARMPGCPDAEKSEGDYHGPYAPCVVYLPTKLGDFGQGQMLGFIFQHHGSHMGGISGCLALSTEKILWEKPGATCDLISPRWNGFTLAIGSAGHGAGMGQ